MIRLAEVVDTFLPDLLAGYAHQLLPSHHGALTAIVRCRTAESGTARILCQDCHSSDVFALSCGHRFWPQWENETATASG